MPPVPNRVPVQGGKPMTVSQTVSKWAEHLVEKAKSKAAKKIGVGKKPEAPAPVLADTPGTLAYAFGSDEEATSEWHGLSNQPSKAGRAVRMKAIEDYLRSRGKPVPSGVHDPRKSISDEPYRDPPPRIAPRSVYASSEERGKSTEPIDHPHWDLYSTLQTSRGLEPTRGDFAQWLKTVDNPDNWDKARSRFHLRNVYAYGEGPREGEDDSTVSDFFFTQSDAEAKSRREAAKRKMKSTGRRSDPTSTSRFRQLERVAYSTRSFQIDRYVAPPGMENVVKRLKGKKGVSNPYAVAWSMYERDKHAQDRSIGGLTRIGALEGALQRSLRVLDAVGEGHYGVSKEVIERLHSDALEDLDRSFERDDPLREAWRHVVDQARNEALGSINRHSEQGPAKIEAIEERESEFPRDVMLEEMTGKGTGLKKKTECYWLYRR